MKRRLLNFLTGLSLLLLAAAAGMWVRSARSYDFWSRTRITPGPQDASSGGSQDYASDMIVSRQGVVQVSLRGATDRGLASDTAREGRQPSDWQHGVMKVPAWTLSRDEFFRVRMGLHVAHRAQPASVDRWSSARSTIIELHYWLVVLVAALLPVVRVRSFAREYVRQQRVRRGLCAACGYNLTANVSGVCPECGNPA